MRGQLKTTSQKAELGVEVTTKLEIASDMRGGLGKWFGEQWTDVKTGKPCGRRKGERRKYPACRPKKVAGRITKREAAKKRGPGRVKWSVTASGKKRK